MGPFKDGKFDKTKEKKVPSPFSPQPTFDSRKKLFPAGEYYGTGYRAKIGKMREGTGMHAVPQKSLAIDPKSLA